MCSPLTPYLKKGLFTSWPLHWQEEGQEFPKIQKNSCCVCPELGPKDIPAISKSCIKIPDIPLLGHNLISYTPVCQSKNSRRTPVPESNPWAKTSRQLFIPEDLHLTEWVWELRLRQRKWMNEDKYRNKRWTSVSQPGSDRNNYMLCHTEMDHTEQTITSGDRWSLISLFPIYYQTPPERLTSSIVLPLAEPRLALTCSQTLVC